MVVERLFTPQENFWGLCFYLKLCGSGVRIHRLIDGGGSILKSEK